MKKGILIFFLSVYLLPVLAQQKFAIPYRKNNLWGICDTNANIIVKPTYASCNEFNIGKNTLISLIKNNKAVVFINEKLQPSISNIYDSVHRADYSAEGIFFIYKNKKIGLLENGKVLFKPMYDSLKMYNNRRIIAMKNNLYGLISTTNKVIIPFKYAEIDCDWEQQSKKDSTYYWLAKDSTGQIVDYTDERQKELDFIDDDDMMYIKSLSDFDAKENAERETKIRKKFATATNMNGYSNLFYVKNADSLMGMYNYYSKKLEVPLQFDSIKYKDDRGGFNYYVTYKNNKTGFYKTGMESLPTMYDAIATQDLQRGIIYPVLNMQYGLAFLSTNATIAIAPKYNSLQYYKRFRVTEDWVFNIFEARDAFGNTFYVGENGVEYLGQ